MTQFLSYRIPNISCGHCVHTIESELREVDGVRQVDVTLETKAVIVGYEPPATPSRIESLLREINYPPETVR
jgi:copper chaperone CopZ